MAGFVPEGNHDAKDIEELIKRRQAATNRSRGALGHVDGRERRRRAAAQAGDEAPDIHDGERAAGRRRGLEDDADDGQDTGGDERAAAAEAVRGPAGEEAGEEAAGLEGRDNVLLLVGLLLVRLVEEAEAGLGGGHVQDAADGARVPAKEHAAEAGGADESEDAAVVDLRRVLLHSVVADDGAEDGGQARHDDGGRVCLSIEAGRYARGGGGKTKLLPSRQPKMEAFNARSEIRRFLS